MKIETQRLSNLLLNFNLNIMKTYFAALLAAAAAATSAEGGYRNNQHNHSSGYQHGGSYPHAHQTHPAYDPWTN